MLVFNDQKISLKQILEFIPKALLSHLSATTKVDYYSKVLHGEKMFYLLLFCISKQKWKQAFPRRKGSKRISFSGHQKRKTK
jgi:hypothetical protein